MNTIITENPEKAAIKAEIKRIKADFSQKRDSIWRRFDQMPYAHQRMHGEGMTADGGELDNLQKEMERKVKELEARYYVR